MQSAWQFLLKEVPLRTPQLSTLDAQMPNLISRDSNLIGLGWAWGTSIFFKAPNKLCAIRLRNLGTMVAKRNKTVAHLLALCIFLSMADITEILTLFPAHRWPHTSSHYIVCKVGIQSLFAIFILDFAWQKSNNLWRALPGFCF